MLKMRVSDRMYNLVCNILILAEFDILCSQYVNL